MWVGVAQTVVCYTLSCGLQAVPCELGASQDLMGTWSSAGHKNSMAWGNCKPKLEDVAIEASLASRREEPALKVSFRARLSAALCLQKLALNLALA